jgi:thiol-disulfide isomerase/thioredoxin
MICVLALLATVIGPVDREATSLLHRVEMKTSRLKGFACDVTAERIYPSATPGRPAYHGVDKIHVQFARPNRFVIESGEGQNHVQYVSDGTTLYSAYGKTYSKGDIDPQARNFHWYHDDLLQMMVTGSLSQAVEAPQPPVLRMLPDEIRDGKSYRVIEAKIEGGYPIAYRLFVGSDLLVHRIVHEEENSGTTLKIESTAPEIVPNPPQTAGEFTFVAAADVKERSASMPLQPGEFPLVKPGGVAVNFALATPSGGKLSLREALNGHKAVLLNFWFVHCPPCRAEHPKLQKFYERMRQKGLEVIGIDDQDAAEISAKYLNGAGVTFPVVLTGPRFHTDPKTGATDYRGPMMPDYASLAPYGVHSCPTNVLIDSGSGKVVYVSQEWNEKELVEALSKLGVQ